MTDAQRVLIPIARDPIVFVVSGVPVPKGRPRARVIERYSPEKRRKVPTPQIYTPPETVAAEQAFLQMAKPHRPRKPLTGPLRVDLLFVLPVPASWPARDKAAALSGAKWPTGKPDRDNFEKLVLDALNGVFYVDDSQVCTGEITKIYGLDPRTEVRITPLIEGEMNG